MFNLSTELEMYDKLKYPGCEEAMSKEKAFSFYIPVSTKYFGELLSGGKPEETAPDKMAEIKDSFYRICAQLRREEISEEFLSDHAKVAEFYRHRGRMLGIDTSFITDEMSGEEILNGWVAAYWQKVEAPIKNPALGEYMFASRAKDSEMFWCFLAGSAGYLAIETAYRWGFDPLGIYREARLSDPLSLWTYRDEAYLYQKWRDNEFMKEIYKAGSVLALGAGGMPELRRTGYFTETSTWREQDFYACDPDPRIDFDFLMNEMPYPSRARIDYRGVAMSAMITAMLSEGRKFDLIYIKGVMSFMMKQLRPVIQAAMGLLNKGGRFVFDLQLKHFAMLRDACIFGWGGGASAEKIELLSLPEAMDKVNLALDELSNLGHARPHLTGPIVMKDPFLGDEFGMNLILENP